MARPEKVAVVDRVSEQLTEANATLLTDYRGLTVDELAQLRAELRKVDASYEVVKNTLTRLAAKQAGFEGLDDMLVGPTAIVFCGEDPVGPAKAIKAFAKDHEALVLKGGYFEGGAIDAEAALKLADLASREELLATMAGMMNNALAGFARLLQAPLAGMARAQGALVDAGGVEAKGFTPSGAAAPAEEAAPADEPEADAPEAAEDEGVVAAAASAVADVAESAAETVADAAESAAETVAEVAESAAEAAGDAADAVAEAVADDEPEAAADEPAAEDEAPEAEAADGDDD